MLWLLLSILLSATLMVLSEHECTKSSYDGFVRGASSVPEQYPDECKCVAEVEMEVIQQGLPLGGSSAISCEQVFSDSAKLLKSWSQKCNGTEKSNGKPDDALIQHIQQKCNKNIGDGFTALSCKFENGICISIPSLLPPKRPGRRSERRRQYVSIPEFNLHGSNPQAPSATAVVLYECTKSMYDGFIRAGEKTKSPVQYPDECKCVAEEEGSLLNNPSYYMGSSQDGTGTCKQKISYYGKLLTSWSDNCDGTEKMKGKPDGALIQYIQGKCSAAGKDGDCKENGNCIRKPTASILDQYALSG